MKLLYREKCFQMCAMELSNLKDNKDIMIWLREGKIILKDNKGWKIFKDKQCFSK